MYALCMLKKCLLSPEIRNPSLPSNIDSECCGQNPFHRNRSSSLSLWLTLVAGGMSLRVTVFSQNTGELGDQLQGIGAETTKKKQAVLVLHRFDCTRRNYSSCRQYVIMVIKCIWRSGSISSIWFPSFMRGGGATDRQPSCTSNDGVRIRPFTRHQQGFPTSKSPSPRLVFLPYFPLTPILPQLSFPPFSSFPSGYPRNKRRPSTQSIPSPRSAPIPWLAKATGGSWPDSPRRFPSPVPLPVRGRRVQSTAAVFNQDTRRVLWGIDIPSPGEATHFDRRPSPEPTLYRNSRFLRCL